MVWGGKKERAPDREPLPHAMSLGQEARGDLIFGNPVKAMDFHHRGVPRAVSVEAFLAQRGAE